MVRVRDGGVELGPTALLSVANSWECSAAARAAVVLPDARMLHASCGMEPRSAALPLVAEKEQLRNRPLPRQRLVARRRRAAGPAEDQGVLAVRGLVEHIASVRAGDPVWIEPLDSVEHVTDPSWAKMPDLSVEAAHLRAEVLASHPEAGRRAGSEVQWEEALRRLLEHHHRVPIGGRAGSRGRAACACRGSTTSPSRCPSTAPDTPPAAQVQVRAEGAAGEHRVERGFEEAVSLGAPQAHRPLGERHRAEELDTAQLRRGPVKSSRGANQQRRPRAVPRRSSSRPAGCTRSGPNTRGCAEPRTLA
jgi:hypothetical protein